jgi:hypothetical protein
MFGYTGKIIFLLATFGMAKSASAFTSAIIAIDLHAFRRTDELAHEGIADAIATHQRRHNEKDGKRHGKDRAGYRAGL